MTGSLPSTPPADAESPKGPTLKDLIDEHAEASGRASENARFLAGAGIAVVWLLSDEKVQGLANDLLVSVGLFATVLFFDFLHYFVKAEGLAWLQRKEERAGKKRPDVIRVPRSLIRPFFWLYWAKIAVLVAAYFSLGVNVLGRLGGEEPSVPTAYELTCRPAP